MIGDLDHDAAAAAVESWIMSRSTRPTVADIRGAVVAELGQRNTIKRDLEPDEAWGFVVRAMSELGRHRPFPETHPLVAAVVARLGWEYLCASANHEAGRARFLQLYQAALQRSRAERMSAPRLSLRADESRPLRSICEKPQQRLPPPDRESGAASIRDVIAKLDLGNQTAKQSATVPVVERREPTPSEIEAANQQRQRLRDQLRIVEGGKAA